MQSHFQLFAQVPSRGCRKLSMRCGCPALPNRMLKTTPWGRIHPELSHRTRSSASPPPLEMSEGSLGITAPVPPVGYIPPPALPACFQIVPADTPETPRGPSTMIRMMQSLSDTFIFGQCDPSFKDMVLSTMSPQRYSMGTKGKPSWAQGP